MEFTVREKDAGGNVTYSMYFSLNSRNMSANDTLVGTMIVRKSCKYDTASMTNCSSVTMLAFSFN